MKRTLTLALGVAIVAVMSMASVARAADDPNGTWKWDVKFQDQTRSMTLKLKLDGDKLTGTFNGGKHETEIEDGTFKDGEISFNVIREYKGKKSTTKYSGKLSGDTIKGKVESERDGETHSHDWEAKRSTE
jgi:hypothetical protein